MKTAQPVRTDDRMPLTRALCSWSGSDRQVIEIPNHERLRGMADDVWSYATVERGAEQARHGLEQAGAELERAIKSLEPVVQEQHQKEPLKERKCSGLSFDL